jgi:hypothetical protein
MIIIIQTNHFLAIFFAPNFYALLSDASLIFCNSSSK